MIEQFTIIKRFPNTAAISLAVPLRPEAVRDVIDYVTE